MKTTFAVAKSVKRISPRKCHAVASAVKSVGFVISDHGSFLQVRIRRLVSSIGRLQITLRPTSRQPFALSPEGPTAIATNGRRAVKPPATQSDDTGQDPEVTWLNAPFVSLAFLVSGGGKRFRRPRRIKPDTRANTKPSSGSGLRIREDGPYQ
jgi:hypothetical protein